MLLFVMVFLWICLGGISVKNLAGLSWGVSEVRAEDITFDAVSTQTAEVYEDFTLSWQHTIGCERSRMLVVGVAVEDGNLADVTVDTVTYNGVALTKATSAVTVTTWEMNVEIWYMLEADLPDAGTYTVEVTTDGQTYNKTGGAISLYNVLQTAPEATNTQISNVGQTTFNTSITTVTDGAWVIDVIGSGAPSTTFTTNQTGQVEQYDSGTEPDNSTGAGSTKHVATAGSTTMGWNITGSNRLAHALAAFAPDPSPADTDTCPATSTITFRNNSSLTNTADNNVDVSMPTGTVEGDLLIATMAYADGADTLSAPIDWTLIEPAAPGAESMRTRSWYKVAQAIETGPYTFTSSGGADEVIVQISSYYDTQGVNVSGWTLEDSSYVYQGTTHTNITTGSVTGVASNVLLYSAFANDDDEAVQSAPGGMTTLDEQELVGTNLALASYYEFRGAGATTKTIGWAGGQEQLSAIAAAFSWSSSTTGEGGSSTPGTTLIWPHTIGSGDNRLLVVGVENEDGTAADAVTSGVTYNGVAMTQAVSVAATNATSNHVSLWYLLEASLPVAGTYNVVVTTTGITDNRIGGSVDFADMKQAAAEATNTQASTSPTSPFNTNITTITDGAIVVDAIGSGTVSAGFSTNQTGQIERYNSGSTGGGSTGAGSSKTVATAGVTTMGWDVVSASRLAHVVAAFAPADTPTPATDLTVTSFNSASDVQWDDPAGDLTDVLILAKTADCAFTLNPLGTEAINTTVGNGVVLFNNDPTSNLGSTAVTVGGATTVSYTASTGRLTHSGLSNSMAYCYKVFIRNGGIFDDKSGTGRPEVNAIATNGVSPNPLWSLNLESINGATLVPPGLDPGAQVYTSFGSGTLVGVGAADGILDWRTMPASGSIQDQSPVLPISGGGNCGAVGATNCLIATSQDGFVYAQNAATGVATWNYRHAVGDMLQGAVGAQLKDYTNAGFTPSTDLLFVTTRNVSATANKVYALNPTSAPASPTWIFTGGGATAMDMVSAAPVVDYDNNRIYVTSSSNGNTQRSLWVFNSSNGTLLSTGTTYGGTTVGDITVSPALSDDAGTVYVGTAGGSLRAYNTSDGSLKWTLATSSAVVSALWLNSSTDDVFFSTANGTVWRVSDDGGSASDVWGGSKPVFTSATLPAVIVDKVYVGGCTGGTCASSSEGRVYQVNVATGAREACRILGTNVTPGDPTFDITDAQLLVGANNGKIYSFSAPAGILGSDPACIP